MAADGLSSQVAAGGQDSWVDKQHPSLELVMVHPPSVGRYLITF